MNLDDRNTAIKILNENMARKAGKDPSEYL
jgi:hypothetical protein